MKKFFIMLFSMILVSVMAISCSVAEETLPTEVNETFLQEPVQTTNEPFSWGYLASIAGASAFTLLFVQCFKVPLDKVWKIPTRGFVYIVALCVMELATHFTVGITLESGVLAAVNAVMASMTAYGAYELTFAKVNKMK